MIQPERKIVAFAFNGAEARLAFTKVNDVWVCQLSDDLMLDLQTFLSGEFPKERVKWVELPNLGEDHESRF